MGFSPFETSLPNHCTPTSQFLIDVSTYFHVCLPTPLAFISTLLGTLSIVSWLFAQMPQIYKNHQLQSTAGLSIFFLSEWLLGDATNLIGGLLTNQATWQVVVALYYVFVDLCLVIQFFWYSYIKPWKDGRPLLSSGSSMLSDDDDSEAINGLSPINTSFTGDDVTAQEEEEEDPNKSSRHARPINTPKFQQVSYEKSSSMLGSSPIRVQVGPAGWNRSPSPRTVLYIATLCALVSQTTAAPVYSNHYADGDPMMVSSSTAELVGTILSWCSTFLYLGSRLPQLYKNWRRQSTAGLSPFLFFAAFCGNTFYSASMLTSPYAWYDFGAYEGHGWAGADGSKRREWIINATPFFLGAAGVLGLDASMGVQFLLYGERDTEMIVKVRDTRGSRWERVSGWMRGWVPSVSPERKVPVAEGEALIRSTHNLERSHHDYGAIDQ